MPTHLLASAALAMRNTLLAIAAFLCVSASASAAPNFVDPVTNWEWRQLTDTVGFDFAETIAGYQSGNGCSMVTGECLGNLNSTGPGVAGWTWASELDVRTLFSHLSGPQTIPGWTTLPANPTTYNQLNSPWATAIIDIDGDGPDAGIFNATAHETTRTDPSEAWVVWGFTRTMNGPASAYTADIIDYVSVNAPDIATTDNGRPISFNTPKLGIWLYRDLAPSASTPIPEPTPAFLVLAALIALGLRGRWRTGVNSATT